MDQSGGLRNLRSEVRILSGAPEIMLTVYTLGTDRRTEEDFIEILNFYGIGSVVDVRRFPRSKIEIFSKENLERIITENGMAYHFLGNELGGMRKGGYERYTETEDFLKGVDRLTEIIHDTLKNGLFSVIICAERFPWKCHRRYISRELKRRGFRVVHIIDKGKTWTPD